MTPEDQYFANALALNSDLTEPELARRTCWYICQRDGKSSAQIGEIIQFLAASSVRPNINSSRLKLKLKKDRNTSISKEGIVQLPKAQSLKISEIYSELFDTPPEVVDTILVLSDFQQSRKYVLSLALQVNGAYQFKFFDACAVMMRRLAEVLIIDGYINKGDDAKIRGSDGNLMMMNGLINALKSGQTFKLSRNAPDSLNLLKVLGDNAAHSRNYMTKQKDIDDFSQKYRMLLEELANLH